MNINIGLILQIFCMISPAMAVVSVYAGILSIHIWLIPYIAGGVLT